MWNANKYKRKLKEYQLSDSFLVIFVEIIYGELVKVNTKLYIGSFDNTTVACCSCLFVSVFFVFAVLVIVLFLEPFWLNSVMV